MTTGASIIRIATICTMAATLLIGTPIGAQDAERGDDAAEAQRESGGAMVDARLRMQQLQEELGAIRDETLEANPELAERQATLRDRIMARMDAEGVDPEADMNRLREIAEAVRGGSLEASEEAALTEEYRETRAELMEARQSVLGEPAIQTESEALRQDLVEAMQARNPDTQALMNELGQTRQSLRQEMQRSGMGGGAGN